MNIYYPLHSRGGTFLRLIDTDELRDLQRSRRVSVVRAQKSGKVKRVQYTEQRVMERFPVAQGNRTSFREHLGSFYCWAHSRQAFAWNAT